MQNWDGSVSQYLLKILIIGELCVGKSCFVRRYCKDSFINDYKSTISLDFGHKDLILSERNAIAKIQIWDLAGQEKTSRLLSVYYREAVGVIVAFDLTRSSTFDSVIKWKKDLDERISLSNGSRIPAILIGTKLDLSDDSINPSKTFIEDFCKDNGFDAYFETSSLKNVNVSETVERLVDIIFERDIIACVNEDKKLNVVIESDSEDVEKATGCFC
eukprot:TRINITY_DN3052_c3_g2_i1.p1 TRINITY_DN3052_c3_g2~~TRINITY_DN3052_c3_g2_i1.p1  ORF type:complete len:216 (-),score=61.32 TRINITY_DN3052_c3_g2_i1:346-993(-)